MTDNDRTAAFLEKCTAELEKQAAAVNGWPNPLTLPEPINDTEREALRLFIAEFEQAGIKVNIKLSS